MKEARDHRELHGRPIADNAVLLWDALSNEWCGQSSLRQSLLPAKYLPESQCLRRRNRSRAIWGAGVSALILTAFLGATLVLVDQTTQTMGGWGSQTALMIATASGWSVMVGLIAGLMATTGVPSARCIAFSLPLIGIFGGTLVGVCGARIAETVISIAFGGISGALCGAILGCVTRIAGKEPQGERA